MKRKKKDWKWEIVNAEEEKASVAVRINFFFTIIVFHLLLWIFFSLAWLLASRTTSALPPTYSKSFRIFLQSHAVILLLIPIWNTIWASNIFIVDVVVVIVVVVVMLGEMMKMPFVAHSTIQPTVVACHRLRCHCVFVAAFVVRQMILNSSSFWSDLYWNQRQMKKENNRGGVTSFE